MGEVTLKMIEDRKNIGQDPSPSSTKLHCRLSSKLLHWNDQGERHVQTRDYLSISRFSHPDVSGLSNWSYLRVYCYLSR